MFKAVLLLLALVGAATAFAPVTPSASRVAVTSLKAGYVPDGLTAEEYEAVKAAKAKAAADRKTKFASKSFEDLTEWLLERDSKFPGQPGAGHRMAKVVDAEKPKPRASSFLK